MNSYSREKTRDQSDAISKLPQFQLPSKYIINIPKPKYKVCVKENFDIALSLTIFLTIKKHIKRYLYSYKFNTIV